MFGAFSLALFVVVPIVFLTMALLSKSDVKRRLGAALATLFTVLCMVVTIVFNKSHDLYYDKYAGLNDGGNVGIFERAVRSSSEFEFWLFAYFTVVLVVSVYLLISTYTKRATASSLD